MTAAPGPTGQENIGGNYRPVSHAEWRDAQEEWRRNEKQRHDLQEITKDRNQQRQLEWAILAGLLSIGVVMVLVAVFQPGASSWLAGLAGSCFGFAGQRFIGKAGGGK